MSDLAVGLGISALVSGLLANALVGRLERRVSRLPKPPYMGEWPPRPGSVLDDRFDYSHLPVDGLPDGFVYPNGETLHLLGSARPARTSQNLAKHAATAEHRDVAGGTRVGAMFAGKHAVDSSPAPGLPDHDGATRLHANGQDCFLISVRKDRAGQCPAFEVTFRPSRTTPADAGDGDLGVASVDDPQADLTIRVFSNGYLAIARFKEALRDPVANDGAFSDFPNRGDANTNRIAEKHPQRVEDAERSTKQRQREGDVVHGQSPEADPQDSARGAA